MTWFTTPRDIRPKHFFLSPLGLIVSMLSAVVCVGWLGGVEVLTFLVDGHNTMKFNTALGLFFSGLVLYFSRFDPAFKRIILTFSLFIFFLGLTSTLQILLDLDIGIDRLFISEDRLGLTFGPPGRMAFGSAIGFVFIGFGGMIMSLEHSIGKLLSNWAFHLSALIAFIAILGFAFNFAPFYTLGQSGAMAIPTAILMLIVAVGLSLNHPNVGLSKLFTGVTLGSALARRFFPVLVGLCLLFGLVLSNFIWKVNHHETWDLPIFALSVVVFTFFLVLHVSNFINGIEQKRLVAEKQLSLLNNHLQQEVEQQTAFIEERTQILQESQLKFQLAFEMSPYGVCIADVDRREIVDVNPSFCEIIGRSKESIIGKNFTDLGLVDDQKAKEILGQLKQNGFLENIELEFNNNLNRSIYLVLTAKTMNLLNKTKVLTIIQDVSAQKEIENALIQAKDEADKSRILAEKARAEIENTSLEKERFLANMSHEIRTPMNTIIGFTNLMDRAELSEKNAEYLRHIKTSGENLLTIINDILDYSKINAGMMNLELISFDLKDTVNSIRTMFHHICQEKGLTINLSFDKRIPAALYGDPTRITQVLVNLLGNAVKFTSVGGVSIFVESRGVHKELHKVRFIIKDTGIGIPADKLNHVFERFVQANSNTTRNFGGSGLGLSIVKNLVAAFNGKIHVSSIEGVGTEFIVDIPFKVDDSPESNEKERFEIDEAFESFDGLKILLVEDNRLNQILAREILVGFGCVVDIAENGGIALEMLKVKIYDLILMDIQMPIMDGYSASQEIRKSLGLNTPIVAMTAHVMTGEKEKCASYGMNDYISKPFEKRELYHIIEKFAEVAGL